MPWTDPKHLEVFYDEPKYTKRLQPPVAKKRDGYIQLESPRGLAVGHDAIQGKNPLELSTYTQEDAIRLQEQPGNLFGLEKFSNLRVREPQIIQMQKPVEKSLMPPSQRRAILEYEVGKKRASEIIKIAHAQTNKKFKTTKYRYPNGILGIDSIANPNSIVYGQDARTISNQEQRRNEHALLRKQNIASLTNPTIKHGYDPFTHNPQQPIVPPKPRILSSPRVVPNARTFLRKDLNLARAQRIRDYDLAGKRHNIVTHTSVTYMPSNVQPPSNKTLAHPSQQSLERGRCLQGSLIQSDSYLS